jgi:hypothetical protein
MPNHNGNLVVSCSPGGTAWGLGRQSLPPSPVRICGPQIEVAGEKSRRIKLRNEPKSAFKQLEAIRLDVPERHHTLSHHAIIWSHLSSADFNQIFRSLGGRPNNSHRRAIAKDHAINKLDDHPTDELDDALVKERIVIQRIGVSLILSRFDVFHNEIAEFRTEIALLRLSPSPT